MAAAAGISDVDSDAGSLCRQLLAIANSQF